MQPGSTKKGKPKPSKPKKRKKGGTGEQTTSPRKGNGLTIPDQIAKARKRVEAVQADIAKAKKRLVDLDRQLAEAKRQLETAQNLPRRSAIGQALAKAMDPQP